MSVMADGFLASAVSGKISGVSEKRVSGLGLIGLIGLKTVHGGC